jgi:hypothetical protein
MTQVAGYYPGQKSQLAAFSITRECDRDHTLIRPEVSL